jgi:hypothetical protein
MSSIRVGRIRRKPGVPNKLALPQIGGSQISAIADGAVIFCHSSSHCQACSSRPGEYGFICS